MTIESGAEWFFIGSSLPPRSLTRTPRQEFQRGLSERPISVQEGRVWTVCVWRVGGVIVQAWIRFERKCPVGVSGSLVFTNNRWMSERSQEKKRCLGGEIGLWGHVLQLITQRDKGLASLSLPYTNTPSLSLSLSRFRSFLGHSLWNWSERVT